MDTIITVAIITVIMTIIIVTARIPAAMEALQCQVQSVVLIKYSNLQHKREDRRQERRKEAKCLVQGAHSTIYIQGRDKPPVHVCLLLCQISVKSM